MYSVRGGSVERVAQPWHAAPTPRKGGWVLHMTYGTMRHRVLFPSGRLFNGVEESNPFTRIAHNSPPDLQPVSAGTRGNREAPGRQRQAQSGDENASLAGRFAHDGQTPRRSHWP